MEDINDDPIQFNSADTRKSEILGRSYLKKKRKFQYDISGLPLPKHVCSVASDFPSEHHPEKESSKKPMDTNEDGGAEREDQLESRVSGKDSNYFSEDDNSAFSVSSDWPSTSSVNWSGCSSSTSFPARNSLSETKSIESGGQERYIGKQNFLYHSYEDQLLEYGKYADYDSSENEYDGIEVSKDKELEDLLHSNGRNENNFILSSGRWNVNQVAKQEETKKLTIDKEFEQYFSTLML